MFEKLLGFTSSKLGPAVISRVDFKPQITMKTLIAAAIGSLILLFPALAYADSAQWNLNPTSDDWNTADNWTPMSVPNGPTDMATFALSNTTNVSISEDTEISSIMFTSAAANAYAMTVTRFTRTISSF